MRSFDIVGMSCAACSSRIEKVVSNLNGVTQCNVNLLTNSMTVEGTAEISEIIKAVKNAGYSATSVNNKDTILYANSQNNNDESLLVLKRFLVSLPFILQNFHGQWYADSDKLNDILHFRANIPIKQYFDNMAKKVPAYYRACKLLPNCLGGVVAAAAKPFMKKIAKTDFYGTLNWRETKNADRISSYYGTMEAWDNIGNWDTFKIERPTETVTLLDHGYDESKPESELDIEDMKKAAAFRGGECLSETMTKGDLFTPLKWKSARGNEFEMTPNLVLKGGHWCPEELPWPWDYDTEAKINPFFAQVWYPLHSKDENNYYDERIFKGFKDFE